MERKLPYNLQWLGPQPVLPLIISDFFQNLQKLKLERAISVVRCYRALGWALCHLRLLRLHPLYIYNLSNGNGMMHSDHQGLLLLTCAQSASSQSGDLHPAQQTDGVNCGHLWASVWSCGNMWSHQLLLGLRTIVPDRAKELALYSLWPRPNATSKRHIQTPRPVGTSE